MEAQATLVLKSHLKKLKTQISKVKPCKKCLHSEFHSKRAWQRLSHVSQKSPPSRVSLESSVCMSWARKRCRSRPLRNMLVTQLATKAKARKITGALANDLRKSSLVTKVESFQVPLHIHQLIGLLFTGLQNRSAILATKSSIMSKVTLLEATAPLWLTCTTRT